MLRLMFLASKAVSAFASKHSHNCPMQASSDPPVSDLLISPFRATMVINVLAHAETNSNDGSLSFYVGSAV